MSFSFSSFSVCRKCPTLRSQWIWASDIHNLLRYIRMPSWSLPASLPGPDLHCNNCSDYNLLNLPPDASHGSWNLTTELPCIHFFLTVSDPVSAFQNCYYTDSHFSPGSHKTLSFPVLCISSPVHRIRYYCNNWSFSGSQWPERFLLLPLPNHIRFPDVSSVLPWIHLQYSVHAPQDVPVHPEKGSYPPVENNPETRHPSHHSVGILPPDRLQYPSDFRSTAGSPHQTYGWNPPHLPRVRYAPEVLPSADRYPGFLHVPQTVQVLPPALPGHNL